MLAISMWSEAIQIAPEVLALTMVGGAGWANRRRLGALVDRLSAVEVAGARFSFVAPLEAAFRAKRVPAPDAARGAERVARRIEGNADLLGGARILWVDDQPANNRNEIRVMEQLGARVSVALTTNQAVQRLDEDIFDLVISDWSRPGDSAPDQPGGLIASLPAGIPLVFYVGTERPVPRRAAGLAVLPDTLFDLVLSCLLTAEHDLQWSGSDQGDEQ